MTLPQIQATTPRVRKVVEAKTFENMFIHNLRLSTTNKNLDQKLQVILQYYDYNSKEIDSDLENAQVLKINNLMIEAERVPLLAKMLNTVVTTIGLLQQEAELKRLIEEMPTPELQDLLLNIQAELGIK